jgi:hypothetical protein
MLEQLRYVLDLPVGGPPRGSFLLEQFGEAKMSDSLSAFELSIRYQFNGGIH